MKPMTTLIIVLVCCSLAHGWLAAYFNQGTPKMPAHISTLFNACQMATAYMIVTMLVTAAFTIYFDRR